MGASAAGPITLPYPPTGRQYEVPIPNSIAAFEGQLVKRLQERINFLEVAHFPDRGLESYQSKHRVGSVLVIYRGSTFDKTVATDRIAQPRNLQWEALIMIRDLGWSYGGPSSGTSPGAYQALDAVRAALVGFKPKGASNKIWATREQYLGRDDEGAMWFYALGIAFTTMTIEQDEPLNLPPLQLVTDNYSVDGEAVETVNTPGPDTPPAS